jgi:hypothetical protein
MISRRNESPSSMRHFMVSGVRTSKSRGKGAESASRILYAWLLWFRAGMMTRRSTSLSAFGLP